MDGPNLKLLRTGLGMTQAEFAKALGISQGYLGELERGEKVVDPRTAMAAGYIDESSARLARVQSLFQEVVPEGVCELWDYKFRIRCGTVLESGEKVEVGFLRAEAKDEQFVFAKAIQLKHLIAAAK